MANVIRLGDPTTHGGNVTGGSARNFKAGSIPMAVVGDAVSCPIVGHDGCVISTGNPRHRINGVAVAYEGDQVSCGATLISTKSNFSSR